MLRAAVFTAPVLTFMMWPPRILSAAAEPFQSGDVVCWVGDSITHCGTYHALIQLFYTTRFPDRAITYWNCGISGDLSSMIMGPASGHRFTSDVLAHKPTVATVMLGMNDVERDLYLPGQENGKQRAAALAAYETNMISLIQGLRNSGSRVILIQPTIYDETAVFPQASDTMGAKGAMGDKGAGESEGKNGKKSLPLGKKLAPIAKGANAALGICAAKIKEWAALHKTGLVDFRTPMSEVNRAGQAKDPSFTIVNPDRIHPGPVGHFVMAYAFLKDTGMTPWVSRMSLNANKGEILDSTNCTISQVSSEKGRLSFDCLEEALPFPVAPDVAPALKLVPFMKDLNQELLSVTNLEPGTWRLKIDGTDIGEFRDAELAGGVNLAALKKTPQYRQALKVMQLNEERRKLAESERHLVALEYAMARGGAHPLTHPGALVAEVRRQLKDRWINAEWAKDIKHYLSVDPATRKARIARQQALTIEMRDAAKPVSHTYTLTLSGCRRSQRSRVLPRRTPLTRRPTRLRVSSADPSPSSVMLIRMTAASRILQPTRQPPLTPIIASVS